MFIERSFISFKSWIFESLAKINKHKTFDVKKKGSYYNSFLIVSFIRVFRYNETYQLKN